MVFSPSHKSEDDTAKKTFFRAAEILFLNFFKRQLAICQSDRSKKTVRHQLFYDSDSIRTWWLYRTDAGLKGS
jgi:hypothetical protein